MPIQVRHDDWRSKTATTTVSFEGESATVVFWPNRITPQMIQHVQASSADIGIICETLEQIVASWDVLGEPALNEQQFAAAIAGAADSEQSTVVATPPEPPAPPAPSIPAGFAPTQAPSFTVPQPVGMYPLCAFALMQLPLPFLNAVTEAVFSAAVPNSKTTAKR